MASRKLEINTRMQELQKEFKELSDEKKEIEDIERRARLGERNKEFAFKVGAHTYELEGEDKVVEATDEDREVATTGSSGITYTPPVKNSDYYHILLKSKDEYPRLSVLFKRLNAARNFFDKESEADKALCVKIVLGEDSEQA
jgi:hypothetical protein